MRAFFVVSRAAAAAAISLSLAACGGGSFGPSTVQQTGQSIQKSFGVHREPPNPPPIRYFVTQADIEAAARAGWKRVPGAPGNNDTALLLTDGTVMVHQADASGWYSLTPDNKGNYADGTWTAKASLPSSYGPLYFASAVRSDGTMLIAGGEYNFGNQIETNQGASYNPLTNTWKTVQPPSGWSQIGDASSAILSDGTYMLGNCCMTVQALAKPGTTNWKITGTGKHDANSEEGWTLLPDGRVLTVDVFGEPNSELYNPSTGSWSSAGNLPSNMVLADEMGPQTLRNDGTVFVEGANGQTAIYTIASHSWKSGPSFPKVNGQQVLVTDGPASQLTNGTVLAVGSIGVYGSPSYYYIFDGTTLKNIPGPPNAPNDAAYNVRLLMLPTGQVLETDGSSDVEIYTPGVKADTAIAPSISSVPTTLTHGTTYVIKGVRFNGFSQNNTYGDDAQDATNYPLVRITNTASGHVVYARTHNHSSMGVASQATVSTKFDVPASIETGASTLEVVANGIPSKPVSVTIQ